MHICLLQSVWPPSDSFLHQTGNHFHVYTPDVSFVFAVSNSEEKNAWIKRMAAAIENHLCDNEEATGKKIFVSSLTKVLLKTIPIHHTQNKGCCY